MPIFIYLLALRTTLQAMGNRTRIFSIITDVTYVLIEYWADVHRLLDTWH